MSELAKFKDHLLLLSVACLFIGFLWGMILGDVFARWERDELDAEMKIKGKDGTR